MIRLTRPVMKQALEELSLRDADIARAWAAVGLPPMRARPAGFPTLVRAIVAQQVSVARQQTRPAHAHVLHFHPRLPARAALERRPDVLRDARNLPRETWQLLWACPRRHTPRRRATLPSGLLAGAMRRT